MEILGKPTINPILFYSGKISGYIIWIFLLLAILKIRILPRMLSWDLDIIAYILLAVGLIFSFYSLFNLGRSTRFGIPTGKTNLITGGLYRISRNPIYFGFNLITISSIIYFLNPIVLTMGLYCIVIYHIIILGEEKFLTEAFGDDYLSYKRKVRRYI